MKKRFDERKIKQVQDQIGDYQKKCKILEL